jgi:hypothetical protein
MELAAWSVRKSAEGAFGNAVYGILPVAYSFFNGGFRTLWWLQNAVVASERSGRNDDEEKV